MTTPAETTQPQLAVPDPDDQLRDDGVDRRAVLVGVATVTAAAAGGALLARKLWHPQTTAAPAAEAVSGGGGASPAPQTGGGAALASAADVPQGGGVILQDSKIVLTRGNDGVVRGFSATCTHQGCLVATVAKGTIDCPCHGSQFDATTGAVVAGPAPSPLPPVSVTVRGGKVIRA
jgi:Rieske Fe-S protein